MAFCFPRRGGNLISTKNLLEVSTSFDMWDDTLDLSKTTLLQLQLHLHLQLQLQGIYLTGRPPPGWLKARAPALVACCVYLSWQISINFEYQFELVPTMQLGCYGSHDETHHTKLWQRMFMPCRPTGRTQLVEIGHCPFTVVEVTVRFPNWLSKISYKSVAVKNMALNYDFQTKLEVAITNVTCAVDSTYDSTTCLFEYL